TASPPRSSVSSSCTTFTTCCAGVRLFRISSPSARSRTRDVNVRTTSRFTSASSSASRISLSAREIDSSSSLPRLRRSPRAAPSRSESASNTGESQCTCGLRCRPPGSRRYASIGYGETPEQRPGREPRGGAGRGSGSDAEVDEREEDVDGEEDERREEDDRREEVVDGEAIVIELVFSFRADARRHRAPRVRDLDRPGLGQCRGKL